MFESPKLIQEITENVDPDYLNKLWTEAREFGGGAAVEVEIGELLFALVRSFKPAVVVETGTHRGFSALMIGDALRANGHGHLYTIDLNNFGPAEKFSHFGLSDRITFIHRNSVDALKALHDSGIKVDFLWLDADHATNSVLSEFEAALPMLKPGTYVAFHDTTLFESEDKAIRQIRERFPAWEYLRIISSRGFDVMRIPIPEEPKECPSST